MLNQLAGVVVGVATTLLLWAFTRTFLRARLLFGSAISVVDSPNSGTRERMRYRVKVKNVSLFRRVADVRFTASLVAQGLNPQDPNALTHIALATSTEGTPTLDPGQNRVISLRFARLTEAQHKNMLDYGHQDLADASNVGIRDLVELIDAAAASAGSGARPPYVHLSALVTESWTGKQYVVMSPRYSCDDMQNRRFETRVSRRRKLVGKARRRMRKIRDRAQRWSTSKHPDLQLRP